MFGGLLLRKKRIFFCSSFIILLLLPISFTERIAGSASLNSGLNPSYSDNTVRDNQVVKFIDENLEAAVREIIKKPSGDIYASDVKEIEELRVNNKNVSDLDGIQYLTGLQKLDLRFNNIQDINPISNLKKLQSLQLGYNKISDISSLENLINLTELNLETNKISTIDNSEEQIGRYAERPKGQIQVSGVFNGWYINRQATLEEYKMVKRAKAILDK